MVGHEEVGQSEKDVLEASSGNSRKLRARAWSALVALPREKSGGRTQSVGWFGI